MHVCMSVCSQERFGTHQAQALRLKLIRHDMLLVAATLAQGNMLTDTATNQRILKVAHYARHGPLDALQKELAFNSTTQPEPAHRQLIKTIVTATVDGCPMLFQPLLECLPGWVSRLAALLDAGADASVIYHPWNASALHMLCYRKPGKGMTALTSESRARFSEQRLITAAEALLSHGASRVLNFTDTSEHATAIPQA